MAAAVAVALGALLGGQSLQPPPVSAAYCDDYPVLCSTFTVLPGGTGAGSVTTADGSISCQWANGVKSGTCTKRFIEDGNGNVTISVTYQATTGSYVCVGAIIPDCWSHSHTTPITFSSDITRTVTFSPADCTAVAESWCHRLVIDTSGTGRGTVTTADGFIDCTYTAGTTSGPCEHDYWVGPEGGMATAQVSGVANAGSVVCEDNICGATRGFTQGFSVDYTLYFDFDLKTYTVTVARAGSGTGRIISSPGGIDCGSTCTKQYTHGDVVTFAAVADTGSAFSSWSGACAGQDATCDLTVTSASTNTATFTKAGQSAPPAPTLPPGATSNPGPTAGPSAAPAVTAEPGSSAPAGSEGPATAVPGSSASESESGAPGTPSAPGATNAPLPTAGDTTGGSTLLIALAIVIAGVMIATGLAVGLRGRRASSDGPRTEEPPGA